MHRRLSSRVVARLAVLVVTLPLLLPAAPAAAASAADLVPPAEIRVCRSSGRVDVVPFQRYVREVLPREFPSAWPMATLRAGAVAIKSYAWYYVLHPYSSRCDLTDTTRHQKYCPECGNRPTARTDQAVADTWHVRFEDARRGDVAFAQYCARCGGFPTGRYIDQWAAKRLGDQGLTWQQIVERSYRGMPPHLRDWRKGFGVSLDGESPYAIDDGARRLTGVVTGVRGGDRRARLDLHARCDLGDGQRWHRIDMSEVRGRDGRAVLEFDATGELRLCAEDEVTLQAVMKVNGYTVAKTTAQAWRAWRSAADRPVERLALTDDPAKGAVSISKRLFIDGAEVQAATAAEGSRRPARAAVLVRSDTFADALAATGLAGPDAPILFVDGKGRIPDIVLAELQRVLPPEGRVHLVGGPQAIPTAVEDDLRRRGYETVRHAGDSRVGTALAVATWMQRNGLANGTVLVARAYPDDSRGWADAVTAGAYAAAQRVPVLLTAPDRFDRRTERWIEDPANGVREVVLLGGPAAVPAEAKDRLAGLKVTRIAGESRDATAVAIAERLWSRPDAPGVEAVLVVDAYGDTDWPFALASAVYAANIGAPQVVTGRLVPRDTTGRWLDARPDLPAILVGGDAVVRPRIAADLGGG